MESRGDSGGEHLRMVRGEYDANSHVLLAFLIQVAVIGLVVGDHLRDIRRFDRFEPAIVWGAAMVVGYVITKVIYFNRQQCIEAFASRFTTGDATFSTVTVVPMALVYANFRGLLKLVGR